MVTVVATAALDTVVVVGGTVVSGVWVAPVVATVAVVVVGLGSVGSESSLVKMNTSTPTTTSAKTMWA